MEPSTRLGAAVRLLSDCEAAIAYSALVSEALALWSRAQEISVDGIVDDSVSPAADALVAEALLDELGSGARLAVVSSRSSGGFEVGR